MDVLSAPASAKPERLGGAGVARGSRGSGRFRQRDTLDYAAAMGGGQRSGLDTRAGALAQADATVSP